MALSIRTLLGKYFSINDLKDALDTIGEPVTGSKEELIERIIDNWRIYKDLRDLLDILYKEQLVYLCEHLNLNPNGTKAALVNRVLNSRKLESFEHIPSSPVATGRIEESRKEIHSQATHREPAVVYIKEHKTRLAAICGAIILLGVLIGIANDLNLINAINPPPAPTPRLTLDVYPYPEQPNVHLYSDFEPPALGINNTTRPDYMPDYVLGELLIVVTNVGEAPANNVKIYLLDEPGTGWFNYNSKEVVEGDLPSGGPSDAEQGTLDKGDKIRIVYKFGVSPVQYLEQIQNNPNITFEVSHDGANKLTKNYLVCFSDDCYERLNSPRISGD